MMEILHKAKRLDNREWVIGNAVISNDADDGFCLIIIPAQNSDMYTDRSETDLGFERWYKCDLKTLCVYTGKNDGKGNKIWGHDVISINTYDYTEPEEDYFGEVVYCEPWACWCIKQPGDQKPIPLCECEGSYKTEIDVLGNIFDNKELLEVE